VGRLVFRTGEVATLDGSTGARWNAAMADRPSQPRIPPIGAEDYADEEVQLLLRDVASPDGRADNVFATFVRHRSLFRKWMAFGGKLLYGGKLPARDRELAILRVGWLCRAEYEWGQHVLIGREAGLTGAEIDRIKAGPQAEGWSPLDAAVLRAADELHGDACITETTWAALVEGYAEAQIIELVFVIGQYHLVSFALNSFGVQLDERLPGF
jgi:4-carboxymuconolactone decarboxylase